MDDDTDDGINNTDGNSAANLFRTFRSEFESLRAENRALRDRVTVLEREVFAGKPSATVSGRIGVRSHIHDEEMDQDQVSGSARFFTLDDGTIQKKKKKNLLFKSTLPYEATVARTLTGHKDVVFDAAVSPDGRQLGTSGADQVARIWDTASGACSIIYRGHRGSVNSVRFRPGDPLMCCTASGDSSVQVWGIPEVGGAAAPSRSELSDSEQAVDASLAPRPGAGRDDDTASLMSDASGFATSIEIGSSSFPLPTKQSLHVLGSSPPEVASGGQSPLQSGGGSSGGGGGVVSVREPLIDLRGHTSVVSAAEWYGNGDSIVSSSWDHSALLWSVTNLTATQKFNGHDAAVTDIAANVSRQLIATSSRDTTLRLWDVRQGALDSVNVFQGHTDAVTSVLFAEDDSIISCGDDRTIMVWDLREMRTPLSMIRTRASANRIALSPGGNVLAAPLDNGRIELYDLQGNCLARLFRDGQRRGHRMATCAAWCSSATLFTAGLDALVTEWSVSRQHIAARQSKRFSKGGL